MVAQVTASPAALDCQGLTTREINMTIKRLIADGETDIEVRNPAARHSLAVALKAEATIRFQGPVGWYAAGMNDGPHVIVAENCGWGLAECQMRGTVEVNGHAGSGTGVSIRGGLVFVRGDAGARAGIAMKGGALIVGGSVGYMSGFMMQRGTLVVCGDAAAGLGDSMYEGSIFVGGKIASLGADAEEREVNEQDQAFLRQALTPHDIDADTISFKKVESGRHLWNFDKKEPEIWKDAL